MDEELIEVDTSKAKDIDKFKKVYGNIHLFGGNILCDIFSYITDINQVIALYETIPDIEKYKHCFDVLSSEGYLSVISLKTVVNLYPNLKEVRRNVYVYLTKDDLYLMDEIRRDFTGVFIYLTVDQLSLNEFIRKYYDLGFSGKIVLGINYYPHIDKEYVGKNENKVPYWKVLYERNKGVEILSNKYKYIIIHGDKLFYSNCDMLTDSIKKYLLKKNINILCHEIYGPIKQISLNETYYKNIYYKIPSVYMEFFNKITFNKYTDDINEYSGFKTGYYNHFHNIHSFVMLFMLTNVLTYSNDVWILDETNSNIEYLIDLSKSIKGEVQYYEVIDVLNQLADYLNAKNKTYNRFGHKNLCEKFNDLFFIGNIYNPLGSELHFVDIPIDLDLSDKTETMDDKIYNLTKIAPC